MLPAAIFPICYNQVKHIALPYYKQVDKKILVPKSILKQHFKHTILFNGNYILNVSLCAYKNKTGNFNSLQNFDSEVKANFFKKLGRMGSGRGHAHVRTCVLFMCICVLLSTQKLSEHISSQHTVSTRPAFRAQCSQTPMTSARKPIVGLQDKNFQCHSQLHLCLALFLYFHASILNLCCPVIVSAFLQIKSFPDQRRI